MNMISERCKRLRLRAEEMRGRAPEPFGPDGAQSNMSLFMLLAAKDMEEAADTIEALGNRLSVLSDQQDQIGLLNTDCNRLTAKNHLQRAEIDKLREYAKWLESCILGEQERPEDTAWLLKKLSIDLRKTKMKIEV